jgi:O-antigen/teichoic acid export membrane protein
MTVIYGLASVPLALRFLSVEEFGLFVLLVQISGYLGLIEMGMAGATARLLVDHKDHANAGPYGSIIVTGFAIFALQGTFILATGLLASSWLVGAAGVPTALHADGTYLLKWLSLCFAAATTLKMFNSVLYAHKRLDIINAITGFAVIFGLIVMGAVLSFGGGLRGLAIVFVLQTLLTILMQGSACWFLRLLPDFAHLGRPSLDRFREMFLFAKDVFFFNIGNQILEASQLIIVTRLMGLTAAAMWSVGTKIFNLLYQLLTRIEGTAIVFFSEMMVRGENEHLKFRFRQIYQISAALTVSALSVAIAINQPFVSVWAEPSLAWPTMMSLLMAPVVFFNVVTRCHVDLILHTKKLLALRYLYLLEATLFVGICLFLVPYLGLYGIIISSLICVLFVRFGYTSWRVAGYFRIPMSVVCGAWLKKSILAAAALGVFVATSGMVSQCLVSRPAQLVAAALWTGLPAIAVLLTIAIPKDAMSEMRRNAAQHMPSLFPKRKRRQ